jgi:HAD superfamily hydrolase (TIGR01509 family)
MLGVSSASWMRIVRGDLLVRPFADRDAFVRFLVETLRPGDPAAEGRLRAALDEEIGSIAPVEGVFSLLAFLRRRGYALGLLSNLSSAHKEPVTRLGMEAMVDAAGFSCDTGVTKPDPRAYLDLGARLGVTPEETLVVGDSLPNDVRAPQALGMRALRVGAGGLETAAHLGFLSLAGDLVPLLATGQRVTLGGRTGTLRDLRPLPDSDQGRYNLVATAVVDPDGGAPVTVYCKRYLFPEGAHVEEFAHRFLRAIGMPACEAAVTGGPEPCLIASRAPGTKLDEAGTAPVALQVGRQAALAYLFANADLRPRNAFVSNDGGAPVITMIDLEHCFFDLALDVTGIDDPLRPQSLDLLTADELARRIQRRVLTPRTMKRARRAFFGTDALPAVLEHAFEDGWMEAYREVQAQGERACGLIEERIAREPFLVIGTQAYRRAMARVDLAEIRRRVGEDAGAVYAASFGRDAARSRAS